MGKKTRKTRWRALSINGHQSDSESQNGDGAVNGRGYYSRQGSRNPAPWYENGSSPATKYHSTHSTPTRRHHYYSAKYESSKSTRSNSTASDTKITFNEVKSLIDSGRFSNSKSLIPFTSLSLVDVDFGISRDLTNEYTRITTPRQDVLFKKGYLSKPKPYLQQLNQNSRSSGPPTGTSTGNSTGDGTPDHQSADGAEGTDIEFEQPPFVYPNNYIDPNGLFFVNGYDPYPQMVVYNPPICFAPYVNHRVKRYSTDSMTESTSPSMEAQEGYTETPEVIATAPDYNHVYGIVYPTYMYNGVVPTTAEVGDIEPHSNDTKRLKKKRRRRKLSRSKTPNEGDNVDTDEELSSEDDSKPLSELKQHNGVTERLQSATPSSDHDAADSLPNGTSSDTQSQTPPPSTVDSTAPEETPDVTQGETLATSLGETPVATVSETGAKDQPSVADQSSSQSDATPASSVTDNPKPETTEETKVETKTKYRVDAEEFVPRAYRQPSFEPVPIPGFVPVSMYGPAPPFVPASLPINFIPGIPQSPYGFITNQFFPENDRYYVKRAENPIENNTRVEAPPMETSQNESCSVPVTTTQTAAAENHSESTEQADEGTVPSTESIQQRLESKESPEQVVPIQETLQEGNEVKYTSQQVKTDVAPQLPPEPASNKQNHSPIKSSVTSTGSNKTQESLSEKPVSGEKSFPPKVPEPLENPPSKPPHAKPASPKTDKTPPKNPKPKLSKQVSEQPNHTKSPENHVISSRPKLERHRSEPNGTSSSRPTKTASSLFEPKLGKNSFPLPPKQSQPVDVTKNVSALPNYSEKLKAQQNKKSPLNKSVCPRLERAKEVKKMGKIEEVKPEPVKKYTEIKTVPVDQWISVSSKKKRKNKQNCDNEVVSVVENGTELSAEDEELSKILEDIQRSEEMFASAKQQIETGSVVEHVETDRTEVELKSEEPVVETCSKVEQSVPELSEVKVNNNKVMKEVKSKDKNKNKKTKKRIIINDEKVVQNGQANAVQDEVVFTKEVKEQNDAETSKTKKKKKQKSKGAKDLDGANVNGSLEENFESVSMPDSELKTNVEVSQELDRMIQRGLYANLEEKIKSVNPSDQFISSVGNNDFQFDLLKPTVDMPAKFGMMKTFNFGMLFNSTTMNKTLEKAVMNKMSEEMVGYNQKKNLESSEGKCDSTCGGDKNEVEVVATQVGEGNEHNQVPPFPITRAVKEWMCRTREHTPEVEIFKDPNEIRNEFALVTDSESSDTEFIDESEPKNVNGNPQSAACLDAPDSRVATCEDESEDLLDLWEEDAILPPAPQRHQTRTGPIEQGEDALQVYESVYGTNADYLEIQREVAQRSQREPPLGYSRTGSLPYRAICCTVM